MVKKTIPPEHNVFRKIGEKTARQLKNWSVGDNQYNSLDRPLERIHKLKPKVIFLTQTSSVPYGFVFKEAWKNVYPDEPLPKFLTIDVKMIRAWNRLYGLKEKLYQKFYGVPPKDFSYVERAGREDVAFGNFLGKNVEKRAIRSAYRIVKDTERKLNRYDVMTGDAVIVLDEQVPFDFDSPQKKDKYSDMGTIGIARKVVEEAVAKTGRDIKVEANYLSKHRLSERGLGPWISGTQNENYSSSHHKLMSLRRYSGHDERGISMSNISYLKELGKKEGLRIRNRHKLEDRFYGLVSITCLIISFTLFSSNITGNAIADLSVKNSSAIGIILFAIVLISGFLWLRNRKK